MGASDWLPAQRECETHGKYQSSFRGPDLVVRHIPECPACLRAREISGIIGRAGIPPRFQDRTFENFDVDTIPHRKVLGAAMAYAQSFHEVRKKGQSMIFCGPAGVGKTHLACAILNKLAEQHTGVMYATVMAAVRRVKETWSRGGERERDAIFGFVKPDLVVLDEVGVQFGSETERLILFEIINGRYEQMRPTILVSNLDIAGIEQNIGYRAVDRLREGGGQVVTFDWASYRRSA